MLEARGISRYQIGSAATGLQRTVDAWLNNDQTGVLLLLAATSTRLPGGPKVSPTALMGNSRVAAIRQNVAGLEANIASVNAPLVESVNCFLAGTLVLKAPSQTILGMVGQATVEIGSNAYDDLESIDRATRVALLATCTILVGIGGYYFIGNEPQRKFLAAMVGLGDRSEVGGACEPIVFALAHASPVIGRKSPLA